MSKRNKIVETSPESEALKALRQKDGLSLRKLADLMEISFTRVHQMESGRDVIPKEYIVKFLEALDLSWQDWIFQLEKRDKNYGLRDRCHELLDNLEPSKLEKAYELITRL
ncbi:MAG: hypothetical protein CME63_01210 [Halobacteriovoraceae bacterium]|nr:hypothetical protein [Halobacteriovoraceae bacterium]MCR9205448.1 helix-turn-helix domain-containing protein [Halobacteriovoraceae bacterium]|tara:strand:+ start:14931 stop:15263 length:333 start_codon:yes stop_codon:yes gene_type:complete